MKLSVIKIDSSRSFCAVSQIAAMAAMERHGRGVWGVGQLSVTKNRFFAHFLRIFSEIAALRLFSTGGNSLVWEGEGS